MVTARNLAWPGVPLALSSALLFGASTPLAKMLLGTIDPWLLVGLLYLGAGFGLWIVRRLRWIFDSPVAEAPLRRSDVPWLVGVIFTGGVLGPLLLMFGLSRVNAASASLLLNLEGLATMALAWLVFRENVDRRLLAGAFAILAGAALLSWEGNGGTFGPGSILIAGACLAWGIDNNLTRKLSSVDPVQIAMIKGLVAGSVNLILALGQTSAIPSAANLALAGVVGFVGYGISLALFVAALRHLGAARTSAYFSLAPFIGAVLAVAILGDAITPQMLAAAAFMGIGLYLHLTEHHHHGHLHDELEHEHRHVHDEHHVHDHAPDDPAGEPHTHRHIHARVVHDHAHYPDIHHRHRHGLRP